MHLRCAGNIEIDKRSDVSVTNFDHDQIVSLSEIHIS